MAGGSGEVSLCILHYLPLPKEWGRVGHSTSFTFIDRRLARRQGLAEQSQQSQGRSMFPDGQLPAMEGSPLAHSSGQFGYLWLWMGENSLGAGAMPRFTLL